jgi:hypothetical protein
MVDQGTEPVLFACGCAQERTGWNSFIGVKSLRFLTSQAKRLR